MHINDFIYEKEPWREVYNEEELRSALRDSPEGACIRVTGHIVLHDEERLTVQRCRLSGPPCAPGQAPQAWITHLGNSCITPSTAILDNLRLVVGDDEALFNLQMAGHGFFAGMQTWGSTLLHNCSVQAYTVSLCMLHFNVQHCLSLTAS